MSVFQPTNEDFYSPLAVLGFLALVLLLVVAVPAHDWGTLAIFVVIVVAGAVLLYKKSIKPIDAQFPASLFVLAFLAKMLGSGIRLYTLTDVYDSQGDAITYLMQGQFIAGYFRDLDFSVLTWYRHGGEGTTAMIELVGVLFTFLPANLAGSFLLFAGLAFAGSVMFYLAVRIADSSASHRMYGMLVFFLPSILFWPSSLGKDAWIFVCSGMVALGWVLFSRERKARGLVLAVIGLILVNYLRPHTAAFLGLAMAGAYAMYMSRHIRSVVAWGVGALVVSAMVAYLVQSSADFLQLEDMSLESVEQFYGELQDRTASGGSSYNVVNVFTPSGIAVGLITALVRPFPWEAHNVQALIASVETLVWLVFCWIQRRVFIRRLRNLRNDPVAAFALIYAGIMLLALTSIGNFGLLARQRVALLPFLWMLFV